MRLYQITTKRAVISACIIEIDDAELGLLVREGKKLVFYAAAPQVRELDNHSFGSLRHAERSLNYVLSRKMARCC